jgi:hypothetical protein
VWNSKKGFEEPRNHRRSLREQFRKLISPESFSEFYLSHEKTRHPLWNGARYSSLLTPPALTAKRRGWPSVFRILLETQNFAFEGNPGFDLIYSRLVDAIARYRLPFRFASKKEPLLGWKMRSSPPRFSAIGCDH